MQTTEYQQTGIEAHSINLIWERTQAIIAALVVLGNIGFAFASFFILPNGHAEALLANAFFLVIGFYFGRTNHARLRGRSES